MTKLYLDIDGVLLTCKNPTPPDHVNTFIDFVTSNFECYWLTTHCKGDTATALSYLSKYFNPSAINKLATFKPTKWSTLKTEAIDFTSYFIWLDDYPLNAEIAVLQNHAMANRLIHVNLNNPDELLNILKFLKDQI